MTIRAVFFDWVNTLVHMVPDRHVLSAEICREFGIQVSDRDMLRGIYAAEEQMTAGRPLQLVRGRRPRAVSALQRQRPHRGGSHILRTSAPPCAMLQRFAERFSTVQLRTVRRRRAGSTELKQRGITTGLISNMPHQVQPMLQKMGHGAACFDSGGHTSRCRTERPSPRRPSSLRRCAAPAWNRTEALHVGDEHFSDGKGAQGRRHHAGHHRPLRPVRVTRGLPQNRLAHRIAPIAGFSHMSNECYLS